MTNFDIGVYINGPNKTSIGITDSGDFIVQGIEQDNRINFGRATKRNIDRIIEYIERLKIHSVEE